LLDVLARVVGCLPASSQRLDERTALPLFHSLIGIRCITPTVLPGGCSSVEHRCASPRAR
jgi:hypothetical protein